MKTNQRGFGTIPLLLVTLGLGVAVAAMYTSVLNVTRAQIGVSVSQDADLIVDQINAVLTNDAVCTSALAGNLIDTTPREMDAKLRLSDADVEVTVGSKLAPTLAVEHFTIERQLMPDNVTPVADATFNTDPNNAAATTLVRRVAKVKIQLRKLNNGYFGELSRPREFVVHSIINATGNVTACSAESTEILACTATGGVWNASAVPPQRKCEPYLKCEYAGAYSPTMFGANPGGFGNQAFNNVEGCPLGFTAQQSGTITKVRSCGKYQPCNDFYPVYSCVRCGQGLNASAFTGSFVPDFSGSTSTIDSSYTGAWGTISNILAIRAHRAFCASNPTDPSCP